MKWPLILLMILIIPVISALCEENQIDINSASLEELQTFTGIGPVKAQAIIDSRPFDSIEDLIYVSGIGPATLENIKNGGACVNEEVKTEFKEEVIEEVKEEIEEETVVEEEFVISRDEENNNDLKIIELNSKVIKTDDSEESYNLYAILGLVTFSVLLTLLFLLRKQKEDKNEFD